MNKGTKEILLQNVAFFILIPLGFPLRFQCSQSAFKDSVDFFVDYIRPLIFQYYDSILSTVFIFF